MTEANDKQQQVWIDEILHLCSEEEHLTEKQSKILEAAIKTFAEKGYATSSTSEIAKKAGVAEGTIFRHYKTKKDLLISIVRPVMTQLVRPFIMKDMQKVLDTQYETFEEFLRAMVRNRQQFVQRYRPVLKIFMQEIAFHEELQAQYKQYIADQLVERLHEVIDYYREKGQIIAWPTESVLRLLASTIIGHFIVRYWLAPNVPWDDEAELERTVQFILHGLNVYNDSNNAIYPSK